MADTRCANPEYQLDVDVMILEYELYRAIAANIKALGPISRLRRKKDNTWQNVKKIADQSVENFDSECLTSTPSPTHYIVILSIASRKLVSYLLNRTI